MCLSLLINSKWIKDLNVRPEPMKLLVKDRRNTLGHWLGPGQCFLFFNMTPNALK
jgi:hypothetical protein